MANHFLGIDIGGTQIKWCLLNAQGNLLEKNVIDTRDNPQDEPKWRKNIVTLIQDMCNSIEAQGHIIYCGISAPGLVDEQNKMILHMPERLRGIEHFDWSETCQRPIVVVNDGHAAALAEFETFYRKLGIRHFLMLTLGTGVGGGIIIDGKLYQGHLQRAGHVGHMTVDINGKQTMTNMPGSLELAIGNFSIKGRTKGLYLSTKDLVEAYQKGDSKAAEYWLNSIDHLAVALCTLTNILAPQIISIGGGITAGAKEALMGPLQEAMGRYEWRPGGRGIALKSAKFGTFAGAMGAALFSKSKVIT